MLIIPAIDLQNGRCVRLRQGRFDEVSTYDASPKALAIQYAQVGAARLHVVDLDGAKLGRIQQLPLIASLQTENMSLQVGGGVRSLEEAQQLIAKGVTQVVIGSVAVTQFDLMQDIIASIGGDRIVLAIDVLVQNNNPIPVTHGWQKSSNTTLWEMIETYQALGIKDVLCTDIQCDGMMQGPNFKLYEESIRRFPTILWQASGGIRGLDDMDQLAKIGLSGAILGRTLYESKLDLSVCCKRYIAC